ncbi:MAG: hypothetical protein ACI92S_005529, partial [Planctomycetaceae bacterium]
ERTVRFILSSRTFGFGRWISSDIFIQVECHLSCLRERRPLRASQGRVRVAVLA